MRTYKQTSKVAIRPLTIDPIDGDLERYNLRLSSNGYVYRGPVGPPGAKCAIRLHRVILERKLGRPLGNAEYADHINGDKLDNRRSNLRAATKSQNGMNSKRRGGSSSYIGVCIDSRPSRRSKPWQAKVVVDGRQLHLGRYETEEEAAYIRDQFAMQLYGEFAHLNFDYEIIKT